MNSARLLAEFATAGQSGAGASGTGDAATWDTMLAPATCEAVRTLAGEAGEAVAAAERRLGTGLATRDVPAIRRTPDDLGSDEIADALASFHFPDDVWARVIYDLVVAAAREPGHVERFVDALVPIYFGRVGSLVIDNRGTGAEQAEERVEHQARQ